MKIDEETSRQQTTDYLPWLLLTVAVLCGVFLAWLLFAAWPLSAQPAAGKQQADVTAAAGKRLQCSSSVFDAAAWHRRYEAQADVERLIASVAVFRRRPLAAAVLAQSEQLARTVATDFARAAFPGAKLAACACNITWSAQRSALEAQTAVQLADVAANSLLLFDVGAAAWTRDQTHFVKLAIDSPHVFTSPATGRFASSSRAFFLFHGQVAEPLRSVRTLASVWSDQGRPDITTLLSSAIFAETLPNGFVRLSLVPD